MLKKSLLLALAASALFLACDDSTSSNNPSGGTGSGVIQADHDTAVNIVAGQTLKFTFVPKAGATYSIKTTGNTDTYLEVRDKSDKTLKVDDNPSSLNGSISLITTSSESVTILLRGSGAATAGATILSVTMTNGPDDYEDDNRLGTARELKPDSVLQKRSFTANDTDWVKIPVVGGRRYVVSISNSTSSSTTYVQPFDKDSLSLAYATSSSTSFTAPNTGYAYVRINLSSSSYTGTYWVRAWNDSANQDKYESNDTRDQAKNLVIDSAAQSHKLAEGEQDWIKFNVTADSTYRISITPGSNTALDYMLFAGPTASSSTRSGSATYGTTTTISYTATATGTMYLNLNGYYSYSKGPYSVAVAKIPNPNSPDGYESDNTLSTAKVLNPDSTLQNRTIHSTSDVDWVKIPVVAGRRYRISSPTYAYTPYLQVFGADSSVLVTSSSYSTTFPAAADGFVYVRVQFSAGSGYMGAYSVRAWMDTLYHDKYESDDTRDMAKNVVIDSAAQPHKLAEGEQDWVKFDVAADSTYRITITAGTGTALDYALYAGLSTSVITRSGSVSTGSTTTITYAASTTGTMFLNLNGYYSYSKGPYTVAVAKIPDPNGPDGFESDNTLSSAKPIVVGDPAQSRTIRAGDVDWIKIPVDSGRTYRLSSGTSTYTLYLQLFDADSVSLASYSTSSTTFLAKTTGFVYAKAYYFSTSYTGSYTIAATIAPSVVDAYEPDDTKLTAKALPTDGTVQTRYLQAGEHDWMKMDLVAGTTYTFKIWNGVDDSYTFEADIQSATSTSVLKNIEAYYENTTGTYTPSATGTHYIDFYGDGTNHTGAYTISVTAP